MQKPLTKLVTYCMIGQGGMRMDFNDWYQNKYEDESEEPMDLEDSLDDDNNLLRKIFFGEEESDSTGISTSALVESLLQFARGTTEEKHTASTLSQKEQLVERLKELISKCEDYLIQRQITGVTKLARKRIIFPYDLTFLNRQDYIRVLRVMQEGNAILDLERKPIDYRSACLFIESAMPSSMKISLSAEFSGLMRNMTIPPECNINYSNNLKNRRNGQYYFRKHLSSKSQYERLSNLVASAYYQSPHGKQKLQSYLRHQRIKEILSTEDISEESQHWKARLTRSHGYLTGIGKSHNDSLAFSGYEKLAQDNIPESQCSLAMCYFAGIGVEKDEALGVEWLQRASDKGSISATYELAFSYLYGRGVEQDYGKMLEILKPLIEKEMNLACFIASLCYCFGISVPQDHERGLDLAELGKGFLLENLGNPLKKSLMEMLESS